MKIYNKKNTLKVDKINSKKLENFDKREKLIFTGASLIGIALYGIMKSRGFDDLESNYPLMGLYLGSYLESLYTFNKSVEADKRVQEIDESLKTPEDKEAEVQRMLELLDEIKLDEDFLNKNDDSKKTF